MTRCWSNVWQLENVVLNLPNDIQPGFWCLKHNVSGSFIASAVASHIRNPLVLSQRLTPSPAQGAAQGLKQGFDGTDFFRGDVKQSTVGFN